MKRFIPISSRHIVYCQQASKVRHGHIRRISFCTSNKKNVKKTDRELQNLYNNAFNRMAIITNSLELDGYELFEKIQASTFVPEFKILLALTKRRNFPFSRLLEHIIPSEFLNYLCASKIYAEINHPLIQKYKVDIFDFAEGAKEACKRIFKAFGSHSFRELCKGRITAEGTRESKFLQEALFATAYQQLKRSAQTSKDDISYNIQEVIICKLSMISMNVEILDEPFYISGTNYKNNSVTNKSRKSSDSDNMNMNDDYDNSIDVYYPTDSVLAHANVYVQYKVVVDNVEIENFTANNLINNDNAKDNTNDDDEDEKVTSKFSTEQPMVTFDSSVRFIGCISNHAELNWRVISIDNFVLL